MTIKEKREFNETDEIVISKEKLDCFVLECLAKVGCVGEHAQQLSETLLCSDYRGHYSHGINRLHIYVHDLMMKSTAVTGTPQVIKSKGSTAWVDGNNLLGPVVGNFCMQLAVEKAKEFGIGWVVCRNSNHFGIAGWYAEYACRQGLVGMAFTNTSPCVFPTGSREKSLGSNPICMAAPGMDGDSFFLDMASTTVAYGKIEVADRKGETWIPSTWGADKHGDETHNPKEVLDGGGLQPLGGSEITGGYKGTGLCMMVEVLCGIMGGSAFGKNIRQWQTTSKTADLVSSDNPKKAMTIENSKKGANLVSAIELGQCFIAIDPECFAPGFPLRLQEFCDETRNLTPINPNRPPQVPGDPERAHMNMCDDLGGIVYKKKQLDHLKNLADRLGVIMRLVEENGH